MFLFFCSLVTAATLLVDPADPSAYATVQSAVEDASDGDTISVAAGSYVECVDPSGKDLTILGAGSDATTLDGTGVCKTVATLTVDGGEEVSVQDLEIYNPHLRAIRLDQSTLELDGVLVQDGPTGLADSTGIYASDSVLTITDSTFMNMQASYYPVLGAVDTDTTITDSTFTGNVATFYGGVMYFKAVGAHTLEVDGCTFEENLTYSDWGGAIVAWGYDDTDAAESTVSVHDSTFRLNGSTSGEDWGGAIVVNDVDILTIEDNTFEANYAYADGGALFLYSNEDVEVTGNLFCTNYAKGGEGGVATSAHNTTDTWTRNRFVENSDTKSDGGALYFYQSGAVLIQNNSFVGNRLDDTEEEGSALYAKTSAITFRNNLVAWGSGGSAVYLYDEETALASTFAYNAWYENDPADAGGYASFSTSSDGNIVAEPMLVSYTLDGDCSDDLHLLEGSPLIDAGDPSTLDEDGTVADIGAYGTAEELEEEDTGDTGELIDTGPWDTSPGDTSPPDTSPADTSSPDSVPADTAPADTAPEHSDEATTDSDTPAPGPKTEGCTCGASPSAPAPWALLALLASGIRRRFSKRSLTRNT